MTSPWPDLPLDRAEVVGLPQHLATAKSTAELILDGAARPVDLRPFDPGRLRSAWSVPIRRNQPSVSAAT